MTAGPPYSVAGALPARAPFDFAQSVAFLDAFKPMAGEQLLGGESLEKATSAGGRAVVYRLTGSGPAGDPELSYELVADEPISSDLELEIACRLAFFLSLDDDLGPFYERARGDAAFAPVLEDLHGLHHVKMPSAFESACWAVLTTHAPIPMARKMKRLLVERYGPSLELDGRLHHAFPEQPALAGVAEEELAETIGNVRRARFLRAVIEAFEDADEEFLREGPYDEAEAWLRTINGVGQWSAAFVLLRGLGRMDRMPLTMKPFVRAVEQVYGPGADIDAIAARYGPSLGYWAVYLRFGTARVAA